MEITRRQKLVICTDTGKTGGDPNSCYPPQYEETHEKMPAEMVFFPIIGDVEMGFWVFDDEMRGMWSMFKKGKLVEGDVFIETAIKEAHEDNGVTLSDKDYHEFMGKLCYRLASWLDKHEDEERKLNERYKEMMEEGWLCWS